VCRRVLGDRHDAEDAFQATFLVLARKAGAIARQEQLASWLHGVARRASLDTRARSTRQRAIEKRRGVMFPVEPPDQTDTSEVRSVLDEELARLPERHRSAILLCELEGLSRRDAASRLGVSEGTLSSRLFRAKTQLRERLTRRGLALSSATLAAALARDARAVTVPTMLADSTIRVATLAAAGSSLAGVVSNSVATLTEGVLKAMLLAKLKSVILGLVTVAFVTAGVGALAQDRPTDEDRLRAVERKLDKLLEVLGGGGHRPPLLDSTPAQPAASPKVPSPDQRAGAAPAPPSPPAAPDTLPSLPAMPPLPGGTMPSAPPAVETAPTAPPAPLSPPSSVPPGSPPPILLDRPDQNPGSPKAAAPYRGYSLAARLESMEQRLHNLEQRLREFERRLERVNSGGGPRANPDAGSLPSGPGTSAGTMQTDERAPAFERRRGRIDSGGATPAKPTAGPLPPRPGRSGGTIQTDELAPPTAGGSARLEDAPGAALDVEGSASARDDSSTPAVESAGLRGTGSQQSPT
jgi:RNA polymerase sigma factor (sigma-70 family)